MAMFFVLDRIFKYFAVRNLLPEIGLSGLFNLKFTPNKFIAFSLPVSGTPLIIIVSLVLAGLLLFIIYLIIKKRSQQTEIILLTTLLFGAISNYSDRVNYGFVIDYLEVHNFAVFNFADVIICLSAGIIIFKNILSKQKNKKID